MPFLFFCLILGMVAGGLLTWFLIADHPFESREAPGGPVDQVEAGLLVGQMKAAGTEIDEAAVTRVLELHGAYVVGLMREEQKRAEVERVAAAAGASDKPRRRKAQDGAAE